MYRNHSHTHSLSPFGNQRGVETSVIPTQAHLQSDIQRCGLHDRLDQLQCKIWRAHERRARLAAGDFFCRATHVDVDDFCAIGLNHPRRFRHPISVTPGDLH